MRREYPAMDIAKFVLALFVVGIHRPLFRSDTLNFFSGSVLFAVAVPFFFIASSFLFFRRLQQPEIDRRQAILRFEKRLLILYTLYTILYLPCIFVKNHTGHYEDVTLKLMAGQCISLAKSFLFDTSFVHFWYVNTLMLSVLLLYLITTKTQNRLLILGVGAVSFCGFCALKTVSPEIEAHLPGLLRNTLKTGLICCCLGCFAAQQTDDRTRKDVILSVVSVVLLAVFGVLNFRFPDSPVTGECKSAAAYLTAFALLRLCITSRLQPAAAYPVLRRYSTLIYFLHLLLMWEGLSCFARHTGIAALGETGLLSYSVTLLFAVAEATLILLLQKKKPFRHLKYLY